MSDDYDGIIAVLKDTAEGVQAMIDKVDHDHAALARRSGLGGLPLGPPEQRRQHYRQGVVNGLLYAIGVIEEYEHEQEER